MKKDKQIAIIFSLVANCLAGAQNVVDTHCHNILPFYVEVMERHGAALDEGFPLPSWNADGHLAFMDSAGISCAVLTMPAPQPYFGDSVEMRAARQSQCWQTVRRYNEYCAKLKASRPDRFRFCASLPLPDVAAAVAEAVYALDTLHADGVRLATNSRGQYLGDEELDPLMEVLDSRNAVVVIHPHKPVPVNEALMKAVPLAAYEYPAETTRALTNMLARNVPARYPNLKFVVPHCGSFLPLAVPRMKATVPALQVKGMLGDIDFEANLSRLYYDLAGAASPETIRCLLSITSPGHILYGSDYPYQSAEAATASLWRLEKELSEDEELSPYKEMFLWENARRLFGLPEADAGKHPGRAGGGSIAADGMLVRISEIEIHPGYLDEYLRRALEVGATSVREEEGVVAIFPMIQKRDSCQVRILEVYADSAAYARHLATEHFKAYKQGTAHMVKSLDLVDMMPMNPAAMPEIFLKMRERETRDTTTCHSSWTDKPRIQSVTATSRPVAAFPATRVGNAGCPPAPSSSCAPGN